MKHSQSERARKRERGRCPHTQAPTPVPASIPLQREVIQPGSECVAVSELPPPSPPTLLAASLALIPCPSTHPLITPKILEQVLLYALDQFLLALHSHPFVCSS